MNRKNDRTIRVWFRDRIDDPVNIRGYLVSPDGAWLTIYADGGTAYSWNIDYVIRFTEVVDSP